MVCILSYGNHDAADMQSKKCDFITEINKKSGYNKNINKRKVIKIMSVLNVNKSNFDSIKNSDKPVLLDFYADWCGPCRMVSPIVDEIAEENQQFTVGKINVDDEPELAQEFGVVSIPTLVVIKDGKVVNQVSGARPKPQILAMLES